jgi:hypothetical protein
MDIPRQQIWLPGRKVDAKDCATFRLSILRTRTTKNFKFDAQCVMCNEVKNLEKQVRLGEGGERETHAILLCNEIIMTMATKRTIF